MDRLTGERSDQVQRLRRNQLVVAPSVAPAHSVDWSWEGYLETYKNRGTCVIHTCTCTSTYKYIHICVYMYTTHVCHTEIIIVLCQEPYIQT